MEQWEYMTEFLESSTKELRQGNTPGFTKDTPSFSPLALSRQLNQRGAECWELVSVQPYALGPNQEVLFGMGGGKSWTAHYLCVFKRRVKLS